MIDLQDQRSAAFPFIVGCGRSGTTLLRAMFDSHRDMAVPPESYFVVRMVRESDRYLTSGTFPVQRFVADLWARNRFRKWGIPLKQLVGAVLVDPPGTYADAIHRVFALYARCQGKSRYGDKTPTYVLDMPLLASLFPEARFLHVVRDGRDVVRSLLDVEFGPSSVPEAAWYWRRHIEIGRRSGQALGRERYLEIRYEDLVADPEDVVRRACRFVGLPFDDNMLTYYERSEEMQTDLIPENHANLDRPPQRFHDWRQLMPADALWTTEAIAGDALEAVGYERVTSASPAEPKVFEPGAAYSVRKRVARARWRGRIARNWLLLIPAALGTRARKP